MTSQRIHWASAWVGDAGVELLTRSERELLSERTTERRRRDFVAGRIAARGALDALDGCRDAERWVDRDELGAIAVRRGSLPSEGCFVSITHADGLAIAAAAGVRIGIDIVTLEATSNSFCEETGEPDEHERFVRWLRENPQSDSLSSDVAPMVLFSAKEAALKWLGVGLHVGLRELEVRPRDDEHLALVVYGVCTVVRASLDVDASRALVTLCGPDPAGVREIARDAVRRTLRPEFLPKGSTR